LNECPDEGVEEDLVREEDEDLLDEGRLKAELPEEHAHDCANNQDEDEDEDKSKTLSEVAVVAKLARRGVT